MTFKVPDHIHYKSFILAGVFLVALSGLSLANSLSRIDSADVLNGMQEHGLYEEDAESSESGFVMPLPLADPGARVPGILQEQLMDIEPGTVAEERSLVEGV